MARLRQLYPQNYPSSSNISAEFESIVRYLNSAEVGNKTLSELLVSIFDDNGDPDIPVEFQYDPTNGLQARVGVFDNATDGWETVASASDIRGVDGADVGTIDAPVMFNGTDFTGTGAQVNFSYPLTDDTDVMVFVNGVLQATSTYTKDVTNQRVTFGSAPANLAKIRIWSIRTAVAVGFARSDIVSSASQAVFPFDHAEGDTLLVYRNGILQRSGGSYDYVSSPAQSTITFMVALPASDLVSIIRIDSPVQRRVAGLMTEEKFVDQATGLILYSKLSIADGAIPQAKVSGLAAALPTKAKITLSATSPASPAATDLWLDTGSSPNQLRFYNGTSWISTNPGQSLPSFDEANALQYVRIKATGDGFEYGDIDLSSYMPKSYRGAANGVASLDASGTVPLTQIPDFHTGVPLSLALSNGSNITGGTYFIQKFYKASVVISGMSVKLGAIASGSVTVQLKINGSLHGTAMTVSNTTEAIASAVNVPAVTVDASTSAKTVEVVVGGTFTGVTLAEVAIAATMLAV